MVRRAFGWGNGALRPRGVCARPAGVDRTARLLPGGEGTPPGLVRGCMLAHRYASVRTQALAVLKCSSLRRGRSAQSLRTTLIFRVKKTCICNQYRK